MLRAILPKPTNCRRILYAATSHNQTHTHTKKTVPHESVGQTGVKHIIYAAALSFAVAVGLSYDSSTVVTHCHKLPLHADYVADAVEIAAPAVVNITSYCYGGISSGSGFIITKDGQITTNAHVVAEANGGKVQVVMMDGRKRTGSVHSLDVISDVALVQLDNDYVGEEYPTIALGSSSKIRNGEFVVALGSPLQLQNSCSLGIISATARNATELGMKLRTDYIQTDAAINRGSSGGPLINLSGQAIGMNVMTALGASGISFAIPIDTVMQVVQQLRLHRRVIRPYVGMSIVEYQTNVAVPIQAVPATNEDDRRLHAEQLAHLPNIQVLVQSVAKDSPAAKCGIQAGDFIVAVDGKPVSRMRDVFHAIGLEAGRTLELQLKRGSDTLTFSLTTAAEETKPKKNRKSSFFQ